MVFGFWLFLFFLCLYYGFTTAAFVFFGIPIIVIVVGYIFERVYNFINNNMDNDDEDINGKPKKWRFTP